MQGCEEKEKVLLLWERALTLFYENDTELFVTGAQERTIAGKIAMHMDKIYREIFPMPELVIDIEYNRMDTGIKPCLGSIYFIQVNPKMVVYMAYKSFYFARIALSRFRCFLHLTAKNVIVDTSSFM